MEVEVNYLAVLVAAVASMFVGFLWYGVFFKNQWMSLMGFTEESIKNMKMKPATAYILQFVGSLLMAYILAHTIVFANSFFGTEGISNGISSGFWNWLGFVAPVTLGIVIWEGKSWKLWFINASNYLVSMMIMGAIIAAWM